jgi:ribosomal protein S18 acetylase RimI-like enzyme
MLTEGAPACLVRIAKPEDMSWLAKTYVMTAQRMFRFRNMEHPGKKSYLGALFAELCQRCQVVVLCEETDQDKLWGFCISERPFDDFDRIVMHIVHVDERLRQKGYGAALIKAIGHDKRKTALYVTGWNAVWEMIEGATFGPGRRFGSVYRPQYLCPHEHKERANG